MYELKRKAGYWCLADISRFVKHDPKTVLKDINKKKFPKSKLVGKRRYWKEIEIRKFYKYEK